MIHSGSRGLGHQVATGEPNMYLTCVSQDLTLASNL